MPRKIVMPKRWQPAPASEAADTAVEAHVQRREARKPQNWGFNEASLAGQSDIVKSRGAKREVRGAHRQDIFHRLHARGTLETRGLVAVRRLQADIGERAGEGAKGHSEKVDGGSGSRDLVNQRQLEAADRVMDAFDLMTHASAEGAKDVALLAELIVPRRVLVSVSAVDRWRLVCAVTTGQTNSDRQAGRIVQACENLADAYAYRDRHMPVPRNRAA